MAACQGVVDWQLSGDDTLRLGLISGPSNSCYINEDGSNLYPSMFHMRAYWQQMSGDPDSNVPFATISSGDSLGLLRKAGGSSCIDEWTLGDTLPVFQSLTSYGYLMEVYTGACDFQEGISYVGFVEIRDGEKYAGFIKLNKQSAPLARWEVVLIRRSDCPGDDLVIDQ